MQIKSEWVGYIDRTYEQIMASIRSRMPLKCPEITDLSDSNPMMKMAGIYAGIAELLNYYIDSNAEEVYLETANFFESGLKIADMLGYKVQLARPAKGVVEFSVSEPPTTDVAIPQGTVISYNNVMYYTQTAVTLLAGNYSVSVDVANVYLSDDTITLTAQGVPDEKFELSPLDTMVEQGLEVRVNNVLWEENDNFNHATANSQVYKTGVTVTGAPFIQFGNNDYGQQLPTGATIVINYSATQGKSGNVPTGAIMKLESQLSLSGLTITTDGGISGGADYEDLNSLRKNVPNIYRTRLRAITLQDFKDLVDSYTSVAQSAINYDGNLALTGYIVPTGGGVPSDALLRDLDLYMADKIPFLTHIEFKGAGYLQVKIELTFNAKTGYSRAATESLIRANLLEYFKPENQQIRADVHLSDLYEIIENTVGVKNSVIKSFYIEPYVRSVGVAGTFSGDIAVKSVLYSTKWLVVFLNAVQYQLFKDGEFLDTYEVGDVLDFEEMTFEVYPASYVTGNVFEFYTYADLIETNDLQLQEFSVLSLLAENLIITQ